ncbi:uncharacterized protein LOC123698220 [Colias croceus]|uniref:uncharacterized protein LOC123698220 n=1 Tax=Colias crocea TaxID=72248 RepID=UPI001E27B5BF|nr:uncharacterized protein LOC123698220 [Colias croceus]
MSRCSSAMSEEILMQNVEITVDVENEEMLRAEKREREEDDEQEWSVVGKKDKKLKHHEKIEIYITSQEKIPKQFTIAKLLKENSITDIERIKYINPYKLRLEMMNELTADRLINCKAFLEMGWRIQRPMEKNFSYGVIRNVEIEMTDEEILNNIVCPEPGKIVSLYRLKRRNSSEKEGWSNSECIRICFKGNYLPSYVLVDSLKIKVDPYYIFPVSQCSRCWKLGHFTKRCPSSKIVCPKCGKNHANCEAKSFYCVNCRGQHMSLARTCPAFLKEKKLREIMAEYNCTYKRALTIYVPSESPRKPEPSIADINYFSPLDIIDEDSLFPQPCSGEQLTYANVVNRKPIKNVGIKKTKLPNSRVSKTSTDREDYLTDSLNKMDSYGCNVEENTTEGGQKEKDVKFSELLSRLKSILFLKGVSIQTKMFSILKRCIEWVVLVLAEYVSDWPCAKILMDLLNYSE